MENNDQEVIVEIASCSNPKEDAYVCKSCERNRVSDNATSFKIQKKLGNINHTCDGYVNKDNKSMWGGVNKWLQSMGIRKLLES